MVETDVEKLKYNILLTNVLQDADIRTTIMIKNIPNKFDQKMLIGMINENHSSRYDFLYLPIDFQNKCNVGYAFLNFTHPLFIVPFYEQFNGQKWIKYNSEKVIMQSDMSDHLCANSREGFLDVAFSIFQSNGVRRCKGKASDIQHSDSFTQFNKGNKNGNLLTQKYSHLNASLFPKASTYLLSIKEEY